MTTETEFHHLEELQAVSPVCEWNRLTSKRYLTSFWKKTSKLESCDWPASWILVVEVEACFEDHDHVIFLCKRHKEMFNKNYVTHFNCSDLVIASSNYWISRMERI